MHGGDLLGIEEWLRETSMDDERRLTQLRSKITNRRLLDVGCGVGGFLSSARVHASEAVGVEPELRLAAHHKDAGLTVKHSISEIVDSSFDVITLFHVLEHIPDPRAMLKELGALLPVGGDAEIIVEVPSSSDALLTVYESEPFSHFTYWSCHLNLFNEHTLRRVATQAGLRVNVISQIQRYPLSNHLHWLSKGAPGGHRLWSLIDSPELDAAYAASLARIGACDTLFASFSLSDEKR